MIVVSDTSVLSPLAAGDVFALVARLFARSRLCIPPAVGQELQIGLDRGKPYLAPVIEAIAMRQITVLTLASDEEQLLASQPHKLNIGERQAIALAQTRNALLLSNDKRATRYCQQHDIRVLNLPDILCSGCAASCRGMKCAN